MFWGLVTRIIPTEKRIFFEDIFWGSQYTYTQKLSPPSAVLERVVHGKACWRIDMITHAYSDNMLTHQHIFMLTNFGSMCVFHSINSHLKN